VPCIKTITGSPLSRLIPLQMINCLWSIQGAHSSLFNICGGKVIQKKKFFFFLFFFQIGYSVSLVSNWYSCQQFVALDGFHLVLLVLLGAPSDGVLCLVGFCTCYMCDFFSRICMACSEDKASSSFLQVAFLTSSPSWGFFL